MILIQNKNIEKDLILLLDQLYIDARYPGEIGLLPFGKPSITDAQEFHQIALQVYKDVNESLGHI